MLRARAADQSRGCRGRRTGSGAGEPCTSGSNLRRPSVGVRPSSRIGVRCRRGDFTAANYLASRRVCGPVCLAGAQRISLAFILVGKLASWKRREINALQTRVFPARAGMARPARTELEAGTGVPRASGDGPILSAPVAACGRCSPLARGWPGGNVGGRHESHVFPIRGFNPIGDLIWTSI